MAEHKKHILQNIDSQIANLNKAKDCVNAAQNHEMLKSCRQQLKDSHRDMGKGMKKGPSSQADGPEN